MNNATPNFSHSLFLVLRMQGHSAVTQNLMRDFTPHHSVFASRAHSQSSPSCPFRYLSPWISLSFKISTARATLERYHSLKPFDQSSFSASFEIHAVHVEVTLIGRDHDVRNVICHRYNSSNRLPVRAARHSRPRKISLRLPHLCD